MKVSRIGNALGIVVVALSAALGTTSVHADKPLSDAQKSQQKKASHEELKAKAQKKGSVRVLVRLKEGARTRQAVASPFGKKHSPEQEAEVEDTRSRVKNRVKKSSRVHAYKLAPYLFMEVDEADLEALRESGDVEEIFEDRPMRPTLTESVPLTGASQTHAWGYSGYGQTIAVLDTGVDKTHPELAGKVVAEACFSASDAQGNALSVCPGGAHEFYGEGAAAPCTANGCEHGTHVAAIAAGRSGVAKDASIIAVQVFSQVHSQEDCKPEPAPCIITYSSDWMKGLEYVYKMARHFSIAAVNMSLGGGGFTQACDAEGDDWKHHIDSLAAINIATVIASGNEGYTAAVAAPACISSAITVGATTKWDSVWDSSNSSSQVDLLAPGAAIMAAIPGGNYATKNGTSLAAPHVAGAFAVLKAAAPQASVDTLLGALYWNGTAVTDHRNNLVGSRIQIDSALFSLYQ